MAKLTPVILNDEPVQSDWVFQGKWFFPTFGG
ncbi:hypothetical protein HDC92_004291 [Pedobacter sp. AK017]|nr:hypothetical protein [Pedobacter sp. AK017]